MRTCFPGLATFRRENNLAAGIYQIRNTINGHCYIGRSLNLQRRWRRHLVLLQARNHHSRYLQRAFDRYGREVFVFEILEELTTRDECILSEQFYLDHEDPNYNMSSLARGGIASGTMAAEVRNAISIRMKALWLDLDFRQRHSMPKPKVRIALKGRHLTDECRRKISEAKKGHSCSEETRRKISQAKKGRPCTEEHKAKLARAATNQSRGPRTDAERASISAGLKRYWARKRERAL